MFLFFRDSHNMCLTLYTVLDKSTTFIFREINSLDKKDDTQLIELMWSAKALVHTRRDDVRKIRDLLLPDRTFELKRICHRSISSTSIPSRMSMTAMDVE